MSIDIIFKTIPLIMLLCTVSISLHMTDHITTDQLTFILLFILVSPMFLPFLLEKDPAVQKENLSMYLKLLGVLLLLFSPAIADVAIPEDPVETKTKGSETNSSPFQK